jgi:isoquinoline 1-oxidoreductase beta subunit
VAFAITINGTAHSGDVDGDTPLLRVVRVEPPGIQTAFWRSAAHFGVTAALYGEITRGNGRVEQTNFDTCRILRINEAPAIEVHVVRSAEPQGGLGGAGTSGIVPAIANAGFAATAKRLRKMAIDANTLKQPA